MTTRHLVAFLAASWLSATASAGESKAVTFNKDIAPILFQSCVGCHRPGEVAPFSLLSYRDASKRSRQIAALTSSREMPPWKAEPGAGPFADERRLSDDQVALIRRWSETGATEGDPADLPPTPKFAAGWQLGEPDIVLRMAEPYTLAASGPDDYRCIVLPDPIPAGKYIKSIEYRPGDRKIVHHAVFTSMPHDIAVAKLAEGDGKSFLSGLSPPGRFLSGSLSIWTPGMEPHLLPNDLAALWPEKTDLVLQLHLHPSGMPEVEQSSLGIHLADKTPHAGLQMNIVSTRDIDIPPGKSDHEVRASKTLLADADVFGVFPHMHPIGRSVRADATLPGATKVPLIAIANWDFNWQNYYRYARPVRLPAGTKIDVRWTFDNSAANLANPSNPPRRVTQGEQTTDEMAIVVFDTISTGPLAANRPPTPETAARRVAGMMRMFDADGDGNLDVEELSAAFPGRDSPAEFKRRIVEFDKDGDSKLNATELLEAFKATGRS